jgi:protein-disulfide isomerase
LRIADERSRITIHPVRRNLPFVIIAAVLLVALGGGWLFYRYRMEPEPQPTPAPSPAATVTATASPSPSATTAPIASATPVESTAPVATATPSTSTPGPTFSYGRPGAEPMHIRGDPGAPVVLEEFGDFQCLPCSLLWPILLKLEGEYENRLVVVFREHPLQMHKFGLDAARAAEAAGLQGKFWEMHDTLYRNRAAWIPAAYVTPYLKQYATELGLDVNRFSNDIDGDEVARRIAADQDRGESLGIDRTPILYLNGEKINPLDFKEDALRALIEKALAAKAQPAASK